MKHDRLRNHLLLGFSAALLLYIVGFTWIEHRRNHLGPWEVTFLKEPNEAPLLRVEQPALNIRNLEIQFPDHSGLPPTNITLKFLPGQTVPFDVPFGKCVFMDPLFLPGTVTLQLLGHQIEMLPRAWSIDDQQHPWTSGSRVRVPEP